MAEDVIVHFSRASPAEVESTLDRLATRDGTRWVQPDPYDWTLAIYPCRGDVLAEYEPSEHSELRAKLGSDPSFSLVVELRRSRQAEAISDLSGLALALLAEHHGILDDEFGRLWTRDALERDSEAFLAELAESRRLTRRCS